MNNVGGFIANKYHNWYSELAYSLSSEITCFINIGKFIDATHTILCAPYFQVLDKDSFIFLNGSVEDIEYYIERAENIPDLLLYPDCIYAAVANNNGINIEEENYNEVKLLIFSTMGGKVFVRMFYKTEEVGSMKVFDSIEAYNFAVNLQRRSMIGAVIRLVREELQVSNILIEEKQYYIDGINYFRHLLSETRESFNEKKCYYSVDFETNKNVLI